MHTPASRALAWLLACSMLMLAGCSAARPAAATTPPVPTSPSGLYPAPNSPSPPPASEPLPSALTSPASEAPAVTAVLAAPVAPAASAAPAAPVRPSIITVQFSGLPPGTYPVHLHSICSGAQGFHITVFPTLGVGMGGAGSIQVPASDFGNGWCVIVYSSASQARVLTTRAI